MSIKVTLHKCLRTSCENITINKSYCCRECFNLCAKLNAMIAAETRRKRGTAKGGTKEGARKAIETKRQRGNLIGYVTPESCKKIWETRRKNGTDSGYTLPEGTHKKGIETKIKKYGSLSILGKKAAKTRKNNGNITGKISKAATKILDVIEQQLGIKIRREYWINDKNYGFKIYDGQWKKMLIEVDGHHWHKEMGLYRVLNDCDKNIVALNHGFRLHRIEI